MTNELSVITPEEFSPVIATSGIEKATVYAAMFAPFMQTVKELSEKAATIKKVEPDATDAKLAREVRLAMVKNRTATEKQKDAGKAALLAETNLIQGLHNVVVSTSKLVESELEAVEKYAENKEKERKQQLAKERTEKLLPYIQDVSAYDLQNMTDDVFCNLFESQKLMHEQKLAAELKAEADRIERERLEAEEREKQRIELERLRKENTEKEAALLAERKAAEAKLEAERKEAQRLQQITLAEKQKAEAELKKKLDAERKAAEELQKKKEAELKTAKKAAAAPDKNKIESAINNLGSISFGELKSEDAIQIAKSISDKFEAFKTWALTQSANL